MAEVKWIKITTDIFDDEKILMIESMPSADSIIVIWLKLLTFAGKQNNDGVFLMANRIAYTDEMLACIFRRDVNLVRLALKTFQQFGMIEIIENVITIPNWNKHQTLDAYEKKKERDRLYQQERRAKQRLLAVGSSDESSDSKTTPSSYVAVSEEDKDKEKELDKELEKESNNDSGESVSCQQIVDLYHSICKSYPKVRSLSDSRKKAIKARLKVYSLEDFKTVFENAESSNFLKGSNDRNWSANFDWLIADKNMAKVLEGNYADKPKRYGNGRKEIVPGWCRRELDDEDIAAIQRMLKEDDDDSNEDSKTVGNDPDLADRAEQLKKRLSGY